MLMKSNGQVLKWNYQHNTISKIFKNENELEKQQFIGANQYVKNQEVLFWNHKNLVLIDLKLKISEKLSNQ
jgi:hypothetical protein